MVDNGEKNEQLAREIPNTITIYELLLFHSFDDNWQLWYLNLVNIWIYHRYYGMETICTFLVSCGPSDKPWYGVSKQ